MSHEPIRLGWEEWLGLPGLGLPAIRAKVDTGARTSALHAFHIEPFGSARAPKVRFNIHPIAGRDDLTITCSAPVIDRRDVTSSNGETEMRYVIETTLDVGNDITWPIEITLTDRATMSSRMLLGRQALREDVVVQPTDRFLLPERSYEVYKTGQIKRVAPSRALRIAVLSREPNSYSTKRLVQEGEERGHTVEIIDTTRCYMAINAVAPEVHYDGKSLPRYDAVIPRIGASVTPYGPAVVRQFEALHQVLAGQGIGMPSTAFANSPKDTDNLIGLVGNAPIIVKLLESTQGKGVVLAETRKAAQSVIDAFRGLKANFLVQHFVKEAAGEDIRCFVLGGKVVASMRRVSAGDDFRSNLHRGGTAEPVRITAAERSAAAKAARAFGLGLAGVDLLRSKEGPNVLEVNSSPGFEGIEKASRRNLAGLLFDHVEQKVRPAPLRKRVP